MPASPVQATAGGNKNLTASLLNLDNGWHGTSTLAPNACHSADFLVYLIEIPPDLIGNLERDVLYRARDVISNATIADIMGEDPNSPNALRDAIRQQILVLCTRLRISLVIVDKLMAYANSLPKHQV